MEYTVDKSDLQTSLEKKIEELGLNVQEYAKHCLTFTIINIICPFNHYIDVLYGFVYVRSIYLYTYCIHICSNLLLLILNGDLCGFVGMVWTMVL